MQTITTIGLDIAKSVFQVHGIDAEGNVTLLIFRYCFSIANLGKKYFWIECRLRGSRICTHLKDTVTYDERLHRADVTARFPATLPTENWESEAARLEGAWTVQGSAAAADVATGPSSAAALPRCLPQHEPYERRPRDQRNVQPLRRAEL
jgi:hypothetical protein